VLTPGINVKEIL